eukprot:523149_1
MNVLILCITSVISVNIEYHYSHCMESTQLLPQTLKMAIGYYNNTIFLLGGHGYVRQITKLDTLAGNYYYNSTAMVPESTWGIWGLSQYYAQWNERLYWIDPQSGATTVNNKIYVYNLRSGNYIDNTSIVSPKKVRVGGCLATNGDLLFVTGGRTTSQGSNQNTVKIYNISSALWLSNIPLMQKARQTHACVWNKVTNELYAIGGYTDTVERIMIHNITNQNWEYTIDTLLYPTNGGTAISIYDSILLIGGTNTNTNNRSMLIQIINCVIGQVSAGEKLIYGVLNPSLIIVNTSLYVFGEHDGGINHSIQTWQYFNLLTNAPTHAPTGYTMDPTYNPTFYPIISTEFPAKSPTIIPTNNPFGDVDGEVPDGRISTTFQLDETSYFKNKNEDSKGLNINTQYISLYIGSFLVFMIIIAYIYGKYAKPNDFFRVVALITASLHILDMVSDVLFAVSILGNQKFKIIFFLSILFIVVPLLLSLYQLHKMMYNKWVKSSDEIKLWIKDNISILFTMSIITGSSFAAIELCHSNLFNLTQFSIPLSKTEINLFKTGRIYSIILFENLPQIGLQCWILAVAEDSVNSIIYISLIFSSISILITVLSLMTQKTIINMTDYVELT